MGKRANPRGIRANRTYTIPELAEALGVSIGTVRGWVRKGLPVLQERRPYLIVGGVARDFLATRKSARRQPLASDQLFCLTCKTGRRPFGLMVDITPQEGGTARLFGLCEACGGACNRIIGKRRIGEVAEIFDVSFPEGRQA